jgi:serine/threonine-protein kinase
MGDDRDRGDGFQGGHAAAPDATKIESPSGRRQVGEDSGSGPMSGSRPPGSGSYSGGLSPLPFESQAPSTLAEAGTRHSAASLAALSPPPSQPAPEKSGKRDRILVQAEARVGAVLGSYRLQEVLGTGGMGSVYRADHVNLGRQVALKLLHPQYARRRDAVARFFQEAQAVNRIRHKNIVDVTDLVKLDDGTVFIIMELLEGTSLGSYLRQTGLLSVPDTVTVVIQICDALAVAHSQRIVHRDLKPDNIFLTSNDDGDLLVKLLDFGVAKLVGQEQVGHKTAAGSVVGTPAFMSPEQAGALQIDHRSDLYSLGAIMYQLFTGQHVFRGKTFGDYVHKHLNEQPEPPRSTPGGVRVDPALETIIMRCLNKSPEARYQSAGDLRDALIVYLQQLASDLGTEIESDSGIYRLSLAGAASVQRAAPSDATAVMWPMGSGTGTGPGTHPPTPMPYTPVPGSLSGGLPHGVETAMAVGDVPGTFAGPGRGRTVAWALAAAAIAAGAVAVFMASRNDGGSDKPSPEARGASGDGESAGDPNVPVIAPMPTVDAGAQVTVRFESRPPAEVFARGSNVAACNTPCTVTIDPRDGGSPRRRDYVFRAPEHLDRSVTVSLTAPEPRYAVELEPAKETGKPAAAASEKVTEPTERPRRERPRLKTRERPRQKTTTRPVTKPDPPPKSKDNARGKKPGSGSKPAKDKGLSPKETLDPFGRARKR